MKEKDYIEELILKNLKELNDNEPPEGHFERFEEKLAKQHKKSTFSLNVIWKIAAAVIFVFLAVNQGIIWFSPEKEQPMQATGREQASLASVSDEYEEVEFYYTNAINSGLSQWEKMAADGLITEEEQQMMDTELTEFETVYQKLQNDLAANPNDERVINAMLEYYQTKLSLINMIVDKLEEVKQKNESHKTSKINSSKTGEI
jgi:hypothetical protein